MFPFLCLFTDNKMLNSLVNIEPDKVFAMPDPNLPEDDYKLMATLSDLADRELVATIGWAKQVPGELWVFSMNFGQLTQKPTHPKTYSSKLWPTHPNRSVNSPKFLDNSPKF